MTNDADAEILCQLPRPEDITLDARQEIDDSALGHLLRWLSLEETDRDGGTARFTSYL